MSAVQARTVLWYFVFVGFSINYLIFINLNIAIVEMIAPPAEHKNGSTTTQTLSSTQLPMISQQNSNANQSSLNVLDIKGIENDMSFNIDESMSNKSDSLASDGKFMDHTVNDSALPTNRFYWNEHDQALALGSFFWSHWLTQIPGGILARKYGTKIVFGLSNVISCWICFLIPMASYMDLKALIVLRLLQGLLTGLSWPAMHNMTAKWIPPNERSKFVTSYLGSSVGIAVFYPIFAYIMHWSSWEWVFHITGIFGTLWWLGWLYFVYDIPSSHPRISSTELEHIEKPLRSMVQSTSVRKTPWGAIVTSKSVWMNVIGQFGGVWGLFTLMTQTPTYFKVIHNWDIRATGIFSGLPHLMRVSFAYVFSLKADFLLRTDKMSRTNVRKLATGICCAVNGLFVLALAYFGTNRILAITFVTLATMFQGAGSSGPMSSMIDIAPNYAGIIFGICGTIGCMPGFISTYIVGALTLNNQTFEAWRNVFLICATILIGSGAIYVCFADSTLQPWNGHSLAKEDKDKKLQLLEKNMESNSKISVNVEE